MNLTIKRLEFNHKQTDIIIPVTVNIEVSLAELDIFMDAIITEGTRAQQEKRALNFDWIVQKISAESLDRV